MVRNLDLPRVLFPASNAATSFHFNLQTNLPFGLTDDNCTGQKRCYVIIKQDIDWTGVTSNKGQSKKKKRKWNYKFCRFFFFYLPGMKYPGPNLERSIIRKRRTPCDTMRRVLAAFESHSRLVWTHKRTSTRMQD